MSAERIAAITDDEALDLVSDAINANSDPNLPRMETWFEGKTLTVWLRESGEFLKFRYVGTTEQRRTQASQ